MKAKINIENLNFQFGEQAILENINLSFPEKKLTAIIGPSGCGKTTLLKSINRLIDLDDNVKVSGKIEVDGENIFDPRVDITEIRRKMGLLLQKPSPLPMSIYKNIAYGLRIQGLTRRRTLNDLVVRYLKMVNLWDEVKKRIHSSAYRLSLGQQQRLCMARGLAVEPEIVLCDEPTASLDPVSSRFIENKLLELKEKYTVILVTHNLSQARRLADYVCFIYMGKVIEFGEAERVFNNPEHEITNNYILEKLD